MVTLPETELVLTIQTLTCPFCHKPGPVLRVKKGDYDKWVGGTNIQQAFPYLTADERETMITGICPKCWPS